MIPRRKYPIRKSDVSLWFKSLTRADAPQDSVVAAFETEFAAYLGCEFVAATMSGRDALELAVEASGVEPGGKILVPAYTLGELLPLMQAGGYEVVPVDIGPDDFNMNPNRLRERIDDRTKIVLATHLLGAPCDIETICGIAENSGLFVIEDCAHALGAEVNGRKTGTFGDAAIFSFEAGKALPTYGGGMIATNNAGIIEFVRRRLDMRENNRLPVMKKTFSTWMEELLIRSPFYPVLARILFSERFSAAFEKFYRGSHDKLRTSKTSYTNFQAKLGRARLREVDERNARMNKQWDEMASRLPSGLTPQVRDGFGMPAFYNFVAKSELPPAELRKKAMKKGVDIGIGGEIEDDCGRILGYKDCPVATDVYNKAVLAPLYESLSCGEFERVVGVLEECFRGHSSDELFR